MFCISPNLYLETWSIFEGSAATGSTNEIFEQITVNLPESSSLSHLSQVIYAEFEAEFFKVLSDREENK